MEIKINKEALFKAIKQEKIEEASMIEVEMNILIKNNKGEHYNLGDLDKLGILKDEVLSNANEELSSSLKDSKKINGQ